VLTDSPPVATIVGLTEAAAQARLKADGYTEMPRPGRRTPFRIVFEVLSRRALVIRDGERKRIAGREVVPGDLVVLAEGDRVPADAVLVQSHDLQTDESLLTGESVPVRKAVRSVASPESTRDRVLATLGKSEALIHASERRR
jgi:P-type E1-E2 ATPase